MHINPLLYRPEIDGLRAVAISLVVLYHSHLGPFTGGFIGVDVFFVISGFLITSLILNDFSAGRGSLAGFYERRCRRILPALVVMCLAVAVAGWFILLPADYRDFGSSLKAAASFTANHYFHSKVGYFDTVSFAKPLLHTWSLSVEEQFYFLLPALMWFLYRKKSSAIGPALAVIFFLSLGLSQFLAAKYPAAAFYLLPSRLWELLTGSLLALWPASAAPKGRLAAYLSWAGLAAVFWSAVSFDAQTAFPGLWALVPCLGAGLFILANTNRAEEGAAPVLLARPGPVALGKISYSLYLWHWPLLTLPRYLAEQPLTLPATLLALGAALVISGLSWRFVENPIRFRKLLPSRRAIFAASAAGLLALISLGHPIRQDEGVPGRLPAPARLYAEAALDAYSNTDHPWPVSVRKVERQGRPYRFTWWRVRPDLPPTFMVMGNSHAGMWLAAVDRLADEYETGGLVIRPTSGIWHWDAMADFMDLAREAGVKRVLLAIAYSGMFERPILAEQPDQAPNEGAEQLARNLAQALEDAQERGLELWMVENVPEYEFNVAHTLTLRALKGEPPATSGYALRHYRNRNSSMAGFFTELKAKGLKMLPVADLICPRDWCLPGDENGSYYRDTNHLSGYGAMVFRKALSPLFEQPAAAGRD